MLRWRVLALCLGPAVLAMGPAVAQTEGSTAVGEGGWTFTATPYVWVAGLKGDLATIGGLPPAEVDASFSDIIENTDMAVMLGIEARTDRWGVLLDLVYLGVSQSADTPGPLFGEAELESTTLFATVAGAYRFVQQDRIAVDALGGVRAWRVDTELDFSAGLLPGQNAQEDETWVDPVLGLRAIVDIGNGFSVLALADIGGFDVGSDQTWEVLATLNYQLRDWLSLRAGYRHLEVDYRNDGFVFDVEMSGPIFGVGLRF